MKLKIILFLALATLVTSGCSVNSSDQNLSNKQYNYNIEIIKSPVNKREVLIQSQKQPISTKELIQESSLEYEFSNNKIAKLDGVVSTAAKSWNLYLNNQKIDNLQTEIKASDVIKFRYE